MTTLFKKGDQVYCPEVGEEIYTVQHYTSPRSNLCVIGCEGDLCVFYPTGYADPNRLCVWHATEENRRALSTLFPEHSFSSASLIVSKHTQFAKDLDKFVSGDYVLVPRNPTARMMDVGSAAQFEHNTVGDIYRSMINVAQEQV